MSGFYDVGPVRQLAINLFHGWGYNFYRRANQLRADDQMVRTKACWLLGEARAAVEAAESDYRRAHLPSPTRANPFPAPAALAAAQALERLSRAFGAMEAQVRSQPSPENDRMTQRHRQETQTLEALSRMDQDLIGRADVLRSLVEAKDGPALLDLLPSLNEGLALIRTNLGERAAFLL